MLTISIVDDFHTVVIRREEDTGDVEEVAQLAYQAILALGFSPINVAESFCDIGEGHLQALGRE